MIDTALYLAVIIQLMTASIVYKDNKFFRFACIAAIAGGTAHSLLLNVRRLYDIGLNPVAAGKFWLIVPNILGVLLFGVFFRKYSWIQRYPMLFMLGIAMGTVITGAFRAQIINQIASTVEGFAGAPMVVFNALLVLIGVITTMLYFTYTREHKGVFGGLTRVGRLFLMSSLGPYWAGELGYHIAFGIGFVQLVLRVFGLAA